MTTANQRSHNGAITPTLLGRSTEGRAIEGIVNASQKDHPTLFLGGVHGDEPKSVYVVQKLVEFLVADGCLARSRWIAVPIVNPDGLSRKKRRNAKLVDINRNFPTKNWTELPKRSRMYGGPRPASEPETRALVKLIESYRPRCIVTIHSISGHRFCNNYDGPARKLAQKMSRLNGYPVSASIGYATPGSFGTWAGIEKKIPTITLELPSHHSSKRCWVENQAALQAALIA